MSAAALDHAFYLALWASFAALHSALAHEPLRASWKALFGASARLAYNALATVHFLGILAAARFVLFAEPRLVLPDWAIAVQTVMLLVGLWLMLRASRHYDMGRLAGVSQLRGATDEPPERQDDEPLHVGGLHARLRHPLYSAGMLIFWGIAWDEAGLATAVWATAYFLIGARLEEHRLVRLFGDRYRDYRRRVPAYVPRLFG